MISCLHHNAGGITNVQPGRIVLQRDAVVAGQPQVEARAGNQQRHTQRRVTPAHQRRPTTPHKDNQLNTPTRATTGNTPTRPLHVQQTRTPRMQHSTGGATNGQARWRQWKSNKNGPERGQSRNRPRVHTDRKSRRRGNPPAPASTPRHHGSGAPGCAVSVVLRSPRRRPQKVGHDC